MQKQNKLHVKNRVDNNNILINSLDCHRYANCTNEAGYFTCWCLEGFIGSSSSLFLYFSEFDSKSMNSNWLWVLTWKFKEIPVKIKL